MKCQNRINSNITATIFQASCPSVPSDVAKTFIGYAKSENFLPWEFLSGGKDRKYSDSSNTGTSSCYLTAQHGDDSGQHTNNVDSGGIVGGSQVEVYIMGKQLYVGDREARRKRIRGNSLLLLYLLMQKNA